MIIIRKKSVILPRVANLCLVVLTLIPCLSATSKTVRPASSVSGTAFRLNLDRFSSSLCTHVFLLTNRSVVTLHGVEGESY